MAAAETALDTYLQFLDTSTSGNERDSTETPHIDAVLKHYRRHHTAVPPQTVQTGYDQRLRDLEMQLAGLLQRTKGGTSSKKAPSNKQGERHSGCGTTQVEQQVQRGLKTRTMSDRQKGRKSNQLPSADQSRVSSVAEDRRQKQHLLSHHHCHPHHHHHHSQEEGGAQASTVQALTKDLEGERERRWKAEQAAVKLADHVRALQAQVEEWQKRLEVSVTHAAQMESTLEKEKEAAKALTQEKERLREELAQSCHDKEALLQRCQQHNSTLQSLEEKLHQLQTEQAQHNTDMMHQVKEADVRTAVAEKEAELQRSIVRQLQEQLRELQELLATRERQHQQELVHLRPPSTEEVKHLVEREVSREKERTEMLVTQLTERLEQQVKEYRQLEEEFRTALRIEASRYQELDEAHREVTAQLSSCREAVASTRDRERKATSLVSELTLIVKEQKGRITELVNSKHESLQHFKERVSQLEAEVCGRNRTEARVTALQEENAQLSARVAAQESVISGLREERKLWGQELALQGATLAQDRGRMEAQIESLTTEVQSMRKQQQVDRSSIQVKEKVIEDQTHTIRHLRQELTGKEEEMQAERSEWQQQEEVLRHHMEQEQTASLELQDQYDELVDQRRRDEVHIGELQEQVTQWKEKYSKLRGQWEERVGLIPVLEGDVKRLQEEAAAQVATLTQERDDAQHTARVAAERLQASEEAFQAQVASRERVMEERMQQLVREKEREATQARQKVEEVEEEMRQMLSETAREKKAMETKFHKLSRAFQELQQEMT